MYKFNAGVQLATSLSMKFKTLYPHLWDLGMALHTVLRTATLKGTVLLKHLGPINVPRQPLETLKAFQCPAWTRAATQKGVGAISTRPGADRVVSELGAPQFLGTLVSVGVENKRLANYYSDGATVNVSWYRAPLHVPVPVCLP